jgi:hypothetical protein
MTERPHPSVRPIPVPLGRQARWASMATARRNDLRYTQGALALTYPLAAGLEAEPTSSALSIVSGDPDAQCPAPNPSGWVSRFLQAVVEVVASERPLTQLARWTNAQVFTEIAERRQRVAAHRAGARSRSRQVVATVHISRPDHGVAEVAARVTAGTRSRAIAARLDYQRGRWLCTAITFG